MENNVLNSCCVSKTGDSGNRENKWLLSFEMQPPHHPERLLVHGNSLFTGRVLTAPSGLLVALLLFVEEVLVEEFGGAVEVVLV